MQRDYLSYLLRIESTDEGYLSQVLDSPAGPAVGRFAMPFSQEEMGEFWRVLAQQGGDPQGAFETQQELVLSYGRHFFETLFQGDLYGNLLRSFHLAYQQRTNLHIRLSLPERAEFSSLPWEYLYDPSQSEFLALSAHTHSARYLEQMHHILPLRVDHPLRMLVVVASPGGYPPLAVEREWLALLDTVDILGLEGILKLERLVTPTLFQLQQRLREQRFHILHFIGHARYDELSQMGSLVFEDDMGRSRLVAGDHLGVLLRDQYSLRLVTLQARSELSDASYNPFAHVAQNLVQRGLPATVALPYMIEPAVALRFLFRFYAMVANYHPVDRALTEARLQVARDMATVAWGAPLLFMRVSDGYLFDDGSYVPLSSGTTPILDGWSAIDSLRIRSASIDTIVGWGQDRRGK